MYPEEQASAVLDQAIDSGIDYLDTAVNHGDGESERRVGRAAPLPSSEMEHLRQQLAPRKVVLERFFAHHHDAFPA